MSYILKAISSQEKLILLEHPHWIYIATGFFWAIFFVICGLYLDSYYNQLTGDLSSSYLIDLKQSYSIGFITPISTTFILIGLIVFWPYYKTFVSAEVGLTSERIIHKTGLILVKIDQVDLDDIRAEHVYHGLLGWLFKYGKIKLDCRFVEDFGLPAIGSPYRFVKSSHNARLKHPQIRYDEDDFSKNIQTIGSQEKSVAPPEVIKRVKETLKKSFFRSAKKQS